MELLSKYVGEVNSIVWGVPMLVAILGTGFFLMVGLRLMPLLKLGSGFKLMWQGRAMGEEGTGEISPFQALMTALSATIGNGNIAGVATAVFLGGPGALFWMWCTALVGMATKYCEAVCAVKYREVDELGNHVGGPMYYIKNGLSKKWYWLAPTFAIFGALAGFGIGNTVQSNSVADVMNATFSVPHWLTGVVIMVLVGLVIIGGIKRIAQVAEYLVPFMAIAYLAVGLVIMGIYFDGIPDAIGLIFTAGNHRHARDLHRHHHRLLGHRLRDHTDRRLDHRQNRRRHDVDGVRDRGAGRWRHHRLPGVGDLRLHDAVGLELLLREVRRISVRRKIHHPVPGGVGSRYSHRRRRQSRGHLADRGYAERDDGHSQPDRLAAAQPDDLQADPGVYRRRGLGAAGGGTAKRPTERPAKRATVGGINRRTASQPAAERGPYGLFVALAPTVI